MGFSVIRAIKNYIFLPQAAPTAGRPRPASTTSHTLRGYNYSDFPAPRAERQSVAQPTQRNWFSSSTQAAPRAPAMSATQRGKQRRDSQLSAMEPPTLFHNGRKPPTETQVAVSGWRDFLSGIKQRMRPGLTPTTEAEARRNTSQPAKLQKRKPARKELLPEWNAWSAKQLTRARGKDLYESAAEKAHETWGFNVTPQEIRAFVEQDASPTPSALFAPTGLEIMQAARAASIQAFHRFDLQLTYHHPASSPPASSAVAPQRQPLPPTRMEFVRNGNLAVRRGMAEGALDTLARPQLPPKKKSYRQSERDAVHAKAARLHHNDAIIGSALHPIIKRELRDELMNSQASLRNVAEALDDYMESLVTTNTSTRPRAIATALEMNRAEILEGVERPRIVVHEWFVANLSKHDNVAAHYNAADTQTILRAIKTDFGIAVANGEFDNMEGAGTRPPPPSLPSSPRQSRGPARRPAQDIAPAVALPTDIDFSRRDSVTLSKKRLAVIRAGKQRGEAKGTAAEPRQQPATPYEAAMLQPLDRRAADAREKLNSKLASLDPDGRFSPATTGSNTPARTPRSR